MPKKLALPAIVVCAVGGWLLGTTDLISEEVRSGLGYPFLLLAGVLGVWDLIHHPPRPASVMAAMIGMIGTLIGGFDATSKALSADWATALLLWGGVVITALLVTAVLARLLRGRPGP